MTGGQASTGKQLANAVQLYVKQHGDTVAGRKIEVILRDDAANPETTKRLAQELIVNDKVGIVAGFGITPAALAVAPLATQARIPEIVMLAGTSIITEKIALHRAHQLHAGAVLDHHRRLGGEERHQEGRDADHPITRPATTPCNSSASISPRAAARSSKTVKVPLVNPDFAPFLQRIRDAKPDALFVFVPGGQGGNFMKQFAERGLDKAGIRVIGPGDVMDDDLMPGMPDAALGRDHGPHVFGCPSLRHEQGVRARLQGGVRIAARLRRGRRL